MLSDLQLKAVGLRTLYEVSGRWKRGERGKLLLSLSAYFSANFRTIYKEAVMTTSFGVVYRLIHIP